MYADVNGDPAITMFYEPDGEGGYNKAPNGPLFLWGQAVFVIAQLLTSGLLHINELDTIRRYLPSYNRPRKGGRYSAFQVRIMHFCSIQLHSKFYSMNIRNQNYFSKLIFSLKKNE